MGKTDVLRCPLTTLAFVLSREAGEEGAPTQLG
jgi:hypothetical protein